MTKSSEALERIAEECSAFLLDLYRDAPVVPVMGEGDPGSPLMMVGEAPGAEETKLRRPFVGKAGKNLDEFLRAVGLRREEIYISNVVKFRPVRVHERTGSLSNRPPTKKEVQACMPYLWREIGAVRPSVVVTLGNTPLKALTEDPDVTIGAVHGTAIPREREGLSFCLFPLYHPASIIYNRELEAVYREDLGRLRRFLEEREIIL